MCVRDFCVRVMPLRLLLFSFASPRIPLSPLSPLLAQDVRSAVVVSLSLFLRFAPFVRPSVSVVGVIKEGGVSEIHTIHECNAAAESVKILSRRRKERDQKMKILGKRK